MGSDLSYLDGLRQEVADAEAHVEVARKATRMWRTLWLIAMAALVVMSFTSVTKRSAPPSPCLSAADVEEILAVAEQSTAMTERCLLSHDDSVRSLTELASHVPAIDQSLVFGY